MSKIYFLGIIGLMLFSSCTIEDRIERREDRIIGVWEFDRVFYKDDRDLFRDNITHEYRNDIIEFYDNYEAVYEDFDAGIAYWGWWEITAIRDFEDDVEFLLDMEFFDDRDRLVISYLGRVNTLTRNRLNIEVQGRRGVYTFRLRRID